MLSGTGFYRAGPKSSGCTVDCETYQSRAVGLTVPAQPTPPGVKLKRGKQRDPLSPHCPGPHSKAPDPLGQAARAGTVATRQVASQLLHSAPA